jgi:hypothetical protein
MNWELVLENKIRQTEHRSHGLPHFLHISSPHDFLPAVIQSNRYEWESHIGVDRYGRGNVANF